MAERTDQLNRESRQTNYPPAALDGNEDMAAIRTQIEQTRAEMSETMDAIQDRLTPGRLRSEAQQAASKKVEEVTARANDRTRGWLATILVSLQENPVLVLLAGLGLGGLFLLIIDGDE